MSLPFTTQTITEYQSVELVKVDFIMDLRGIRGLQTSARLQRHPGITYPHRLSWQWLIEKSIDPNQYTVDPIRKIRTGGRGPDGRFHFYFEPSIVRLSLH